MDSAECTQKLTEARDALHQLMTGSQVVEVRNENTTTRYSPANQDALVQYIAQLEAQCRCVLGFPARRSPMGVEF